MVKLQSLVEYCDQLLAAGDYSDYAPNGLQVQGRDEVRRIVAGVTASQALIDAAVASQADLLLVHHGFFWKGESAVITGMRQRRIKALLEHDISLLAYHLPLDGHPVLGNNARLGARWGLSEEGRFGHGPNGGIGCYGRLAEPLSPQILSEHISKDLGREALLIDGGNGPIERLGWCSGGAQDYIEQAAALGLDAYVSGEISERTVHQARELGIHYIAAGHHATERYGAMALGAQLAERFAIQCEFIDIDNPV